MRWSLLLALVLVACSQPRSEPATTICMDEATRERLRTLMLETLDEALKLQVMHLFEVWMRDERDQPARAAHGTQQALRAYLQARSSTLRWHPPEC